MQADREHVDDGVVGTWLRFGEVLVVGWASDLRLDRSSVTGLVGRAEERGFVRRERSTEDGRGVQVLSTARGQELAAQVHAEVADRLSALTRMLSPSERTRMAALIDRMVSVG